MTDRFEYNWNLDGFVDEQRCYMSENPIDTNAPPAPVAILNGSDRTHIESGLTPGKYYYTRMSAYKNGTEKFSDEKKVLFGKEWAPNNLTNQAKLWLSAESAIVDSLNRISSVQDLSPSSSNATQTADNLKPTLIADEIYFDGVNDYLDINAKTLFTNVNFGWIFAVVNKKELDPSVGEKAIIGWSTNGGGFRIGLLHANTIRKNQFILSARRTDSESVEGIATGVEIEAERDYIVLGLVNYATRYLALYVDGALAVSKENGFTSGAGFTSNTSSANARIGAGITANPASYSKDGIKQIIANNQFLSTEDRQKLEGWAAHKYGLLGNLPADHPYKVFAPVL